MNAASTLLIVTLCLSPADAPKATGDAAKLQGVWDYKSLEIGGNKIDPAMFAGSHTEIAGDKFTTTSGTVVYKGTFKLDPTQKPKTMDVTFTQGPEQGKTAKAIYELDGDTWKICIPIKGDDRPKEFATKADDGFALETLTRRKPAAPDAAALKTEMAKFAGEWSMITGESNGQVAPDDMKAKFKRIAKGDETSLLFDDTIRFKAKFTIDPAKKPKTIDYTMTDGPNKGKKQLGIYEFDGETLKVCFAAPDGERPTDFTAPSGSNRTSSTWKKAKK